MRPATDDEFKLSFPVAKDRTLRRIKIVQVSIFISMLISISVMFLGFYLSMPYYPKWDTYGETDPSSPFYWIAILSFLIFSMSIPSLIIVNIIDGIVFTKRYGWRAVKDPIEAQRIAMREALYDVATSSTQAMLDNNGDQIIVVPTQRLRPLGARLEMTAERDKAQVPRAVR